LDHGRLGLIPMIESWCGWVRPSICILRVVSKRGELVETSVGTMNCFADFFLRVLNHLELWEKRGERCLAGTEKVWRDGREESSFLFSVSCHPLD